MSHEKLSSIALVSYTLLGDFEIHSGHGLEMSNGTDTLFTKTEVET